jgi:cyanophycin synthetase
MRPNVTVFDGPNLLVPYPAVVVEADRPRVLPPRDAVERQLRRLLSPALLAGLPLPLAYDSFEAVLGALVRSLYELHGDIGLPITVERQGNDACRIIAGCLDPAPTSLAVHIALDLATISFAEAAGKPSHARQVAGQLQVLANQLKGRLPDPLARSLIAAARRRGIPVTPVSPGSRIWLYGQGSRGVQLFEAASQFDALTGTRLARNKVLANQLVARLGFPGVRHSTATSAASAQRIAKELGFPVVVKPAASGKGAGVTVHITDDAALLAAFTIAQKIGQGDVLVERHVAGEDHRLVVIGGQFAWAVRRSPPQLVGDGEHTIQELLEAENNRRAALPAADIAATKLAFDGEVRSLLAAQGFKADDRPPAGTTVLLRRIANISRGGTLTDCTASVHPEVRDMAEAIARSIHLDAIGIDFMTPDITRSWREVDCAVLEVNSTPGFSSDARAELILDRRFPHGNDGRLPSVVLIGAGERELAAVAQLLDRQGLRVGCTDGKATTLGGQPRMTGPAALPARVTALVLDAGCDALVIGATATEIERHGLPLDRCHLALIGAAPPGEALEALLVAHSAKVQRLPASGVADETVAAAVLELMSSRTQTP